ncbi:hypothetical protein HFN52_10975 [Rhizobium leguminosarum]|nr:hypothetical protein [Rhizobium leguminosarum]
MPRQWYPVFLIDETLPTGRDSAEAWLPYLTAPFGPSPLPMFNPGDEVSFKWCEDRGRITVQILPSGDVTPGPRCSKTPDLFQGVAGPDGPEAVATDANSFWDFESETWSDTLTGFARDYAAEIDPSEIDGHTVDIDTACWSDAIIFTISPDGKTLIPATSPETVTNV